MHQKIFLNTLYQVIQKVLTASITLLITILTAQALGVTGYGQLVQITTTVGMLYLVVDFGMNAIALQDDPHKNFGNLLVARILLALSSVGIIALLVVVLPFSDFFEIGFSPMVKTGMIIFSLTLIAQAVLLSATSIYQKELRYSALLLISLVGSSVTMAFIFYAFLTNISLLFVVGSFVVGSIVTALLSFIFIYKKVNMKVDHLKVKLLFLKSLPLGLMLIFNLIYFRIDIFILSFLKSTADVGTYGLSYRFFDFLIALPLFLSNALYPMLLENQKNFRRNGKMVAAYTVCAMIIGVVLAIVLWFLAPLIILIKQDFVGAIASFRLLLFSLPFFFGTSLLQWGIIAEKKQKFLMWTYLFCAIFNVGLNIIFIPIGSYLASAMITGITECVVFVVLASYYYKNYMRSAT